MKRLRPTPKTLLDRMKLPKVNRDVQVGNWPVEPEDVAAIEDALRELGDYAHGCRCWGIDDEILTKARSALARLKGEE